MDEDILQEFLEESWENLGQLDTEIVALEKDPSNPDLIASIFRTIHTIKGTCGFINLTNLGSVAHSAENVLGKMREKTLDISLDSISLVLSAVDVIKELLEGLEATNEEPKTDNSQLIKELDYLADNGTLLGGSAEATPVEPAPTVEVPVVEVPVETIAPPTEVIAEIEPPAAVEAPQPVEPVAEKPTPPPTPVKPEAPTMEEAPAKKKKSVADLSIRVNVDVLDSLMNMVGELVLTRNQLLQLLRDDDESVYAAPITHLDRVTTDLQEGVMKTRMQPIGNAWSKLPRLVRDLTQITGHQIELVMNGAETELDRTVLDAIKDPLTHMVRNSADHGIEDPATRRAAGKNEVGTVHLNAYHEGGHVVISIKDDGAGINTERVLQKAIQNGAVDQATADNMSHSEILMLIFNAGFSTAEKVSSVSGRGVGMDVVKTQIERIGGTVELISEMGKGTTVLIKIPLTLAIISALVVESGGESFAIPQLGVVELVRLDAESKKKRVERIHNHEVFRLRDRLLPLVHLNSVLGLPDTEHEEEHDINIVVVQVGEEQLGLIVTEVFDTEEIVVKPVGSLLKNINIYQGTTILGDGRVIMILDVAGIASQFTGLPKSAMQQPADTDADLAGDKTSLLLFDAGGGAIMSVPLSLVARLEEIPQESIERSGDKMVVQYRDHLLPLLPINGMIPTQESPDPQPVIVFSDGDKSMGLMVEKIQDIIDEQLTIQMQSTRPGVLGTAILNEKATDVIDTQYYVTQASPDWFEKKENVTQQHVLVVDESLFFRQLVTTALESEGFRVTSKESAIDAIEAIESGKQFNVIVTEVDLPMMDGFEFCKWFNERTNVNHIPRIALTANNDPGIELDGMDAGFHKLLKKFNAQQLISTITELSCQLQAMEVKV